MRTYHQLLDEMAYRKAAGLPRIELTAAEKARAFGDANLRRGENDRAESLLERLQQGLTLSISDRREAKRYLKQKCAN